MFQSQEAALSLGTQAPGLFYIGNSAECKLFALPITAGSIQRDMEETLATSTGYMIDSGVKRS